MTTCFPLRRYGVGHQISLQVLLCFCPVITLSAPEIHRPAVSRPYLAAVGPPSLRFAEVPPPPDLRVRPTSGLGDQATAPEPAAATLPGGSTSPPPPAADTRDPAVAVAVEAPPKGHGEVRPAKPMPPPILPDDIREKAKPEDFLPFFKFPETTGLPAPAAPRTQPESSATYRQE